MVMAQQRGGHLTISKLSRRLHRPRARGAGISLNNVSGTGFVESLRGRIVATDSTFDRLRVRTATGDMLFQGLHVAANPGDERVRIDRLRRRRLRAGLARFESEHGNVALGVRGNAQIGAHSGSGHVESSFDDDAQVRGDPTTKQATVGGGGPVVTATSKNGSVYLYSGSMNEHPHVRQELSGSTRLPMRSKAATPPAERPPPPFKRPPRRPPSRDPTESVVGGNRAHAEFVFEFGGELRRIGLEHLRSEVLKDGDLRPHVGNDAARVGPRKMIDLHVVAEAQHVDDQARPGGARVIGGEPIEVSAARKIRRREGRRARSAGRASRPRARGASRCRARRRRSR